MQKTQLNNKKNILVFFLITIIFYSFFYYTAAPSKPIIEPFLEINEFSGWELWYDQGQYYQMSSAIFDGTFNSTNYGYPLGYPVLGVPSLLLGSDSSFFSHHRFFIPNLLLFLGTTYLTFRITLEFTKKYQAAILSLVFLLFLTPYLFWFMEPWNIHVLDIGFIGIFYLLFRQSKTISKNQVIIIGLLGGWIFATRIVDILWLIPILAVFLIFNLSKAKYLIPGIILIILVFGTHLIYFNDPFTFPYSLQPALEENSSDRLLYELVGFQKFDWNVIIMSERAYCILIEPLYCLPEKTGSDFVDTWHYNSLFNKIPILNYGSWFLVLSPLGFYFLTRHFHGQQKWTLIAFMISFISSSLFYLADYAFTSGWTIFFRYQMPWLPLSTIFSIYIITFLYNKIKPNT